MSVKQEYEEKYVVICKRVEAHLLTSIDDYKEECDKKRNDKSECQNQAERNKKFPELHIYSRIKTFESVKDKCRRKKMRCTIENIKTFNDIVGIRIVTPYLDSIPIIVEALKSRLRLETRIIKDYISEPKENGYRSLHVVVKRELYFDEETNMIPAEIQIRTSFQETWASEEHKNNYKNENANPKLMERHRIFAEKINELEKEMMELRDLSLTQ